MRIFIDAGHNERGHDIGYIHSGLYEHLINFEVAKLFGDLLSLFGHDVFYSRNNTRDILGSNTASSIMERFQTANALKADFLLSLHCGLGGCSGTRSYYHRADSKDFATNLSDCYARFMGIKNLGAFYTDKIGILMQTNMPSACIELGFLDNDFDSVRLRTQRHQIALMLFNSFTRFIK